MIAESLLGGVSIQQEVLKIAILRPPQLMVLLLLNLNCLFFRLCCTSGATARNLDGTMKTVGLKSSTIFKNHLTN